MAGVRIQPHAIGNYGGSAPGWEQLELWRYGFRMDYDPRYPVPFDTERGPMARHGLVPVSMEDKMGWAKITGLLSDPPCFKDLLRATFWTPPHPSYIELDENTIPYMQVYRDHIPEGERGDFVLAYHKRLTSSDAQVRLEAALPVQRQGVRDGQPAGVRRVQVQGVRP